MTQDEKRADAMSNTELREEKPCCVCCEKKPTRVLYEWPANFYEHSKFETASWDGRQSIPLRIVKCEACSLVFTSPSFRAENLNHVYPDDIVPQEIERESLLASRKWDNLIEIIQNHIPPASMVCDIGTRYGVLVHKLAEKGYQAWGVEYNPSAVEKGKSLGFQSVYQGLISDLPRICDEQGFAHVNAFVMDDVLEHLVSPREDLVQLSRVQNAGDVLIARQMDLDSWGHRLFKKNWYYLQPAAHMYFFNEKTAVKLLDKVGYELVSVTRTPLRLNAFNLLQLVKRRVFGQQRAWEINGRTMYLSERDKLSDMFTIVARKL